MIPLYGNRIMLELRTQSKQEIKLGHVVLQHVMQWSMLINKVI